MPRFTRMFSFALVAILAVGTVAVPAQADGHYVNDGVNKPTITDVRVSGDVTFNASYFVDMHFNPSGWTDPPDRIWTRLKFACESKGVMTGFFAFQSPQNSASATTEIAAGETATNFVIVDFDHFSPLTNDCDTYTGFTGTTIEYFNVIVAAEVVSYEINGQLHNGAPPGAEQEPLFYTNSFAEINGCAKTASCGGGGPIGGCELPFNDTNDTVFCPEIDWLVTSGITVGCGVNLFCPTAPVTRGEMAVFLDRWLNLTDQPGADTFSDDNGHFAEEAIESLVASGITQGIGDGRFGPNLSVTRGQMALFLTRALNLPARPGADTYGDDNGHFAEEAIESLAGLGITRGCSGTTFCPDQVVTREQMAAFIYRGDEWQRAQP